MEKTNTWHQHSLHHSAKKAHTQPIISLSPLNQNLFYTSSEDNTLRLWDIRLHSSVKLFQNAALTHLTNCDNNQQHLLFVGNNKYLYSFDTRKQSIFVDQIQSKSKQAHLDDISYIRYNKNKGMVGAGDDEGNINLYDGGLGCIGSLIDSHNNIINAVEFISTQQMNLCVTGGFDAKLVYWNMENNKIAKQLDMQQVFKKNQVTTNAIPFIYHIHLHRNTLYVSMQTGHVLAFPIKQPKKHKYILEASLSKIVHTKVPEFNQNLMITLSVDGSFSLFDHTKRYNNAPLFLQKYKCVDEPNWIDIIKNQIIVSSANCPELHFYAVK